MGLTVDVLLVIFGLIYICQSDEWKSTLQSVIQRAGEAENRLTEVREDGPGGYDGEQRKLVIRQILYVSCHRSSGVNGMSQHDY